MVIGSLIHDIRKHCKDSWCVFLIDDAARVTPVTMVLTEKWDHRDSMEKLENQAEKEKEV